MFAFTLVNNLKMAGCQLFLLLSTVFFVIIYILTAVISTGCEHYLPLNQRTGILSSINTVSIC